MGANIILKLLLLLTSLAAAATLIPDNSDEPSASTAPSRHRHRTPTRHRASTVTPTRLYASRCRPGHSYWHAERERCARCSRCDRGEIVVRPCDLDRDVRCGPIADLDREYWEWLEQRGAMLEEPKPVDDGGVTLEVQSPPGAHWQLDWQAEVLLVAISLCALFFAVAAGYSLHHARHWRLLEEHYESDVEEISSRLALMTAANAASAVNCQQANGTVILPPTAETSQELHCANLEQLLAGKSSSRHPGRCNVYIEDNKT